MKTIYLHGILAKKFGKKFELDVFSPLEALKALCYMIEGFRQEFEKYSYKVVKGKLKGGWELDENTASMGIGSFEEVHFVPVVSGSKKAFKAILGVVLIAAAFTTGFGVLSTANVFAQFGFATGASMAVTGTLLLLGGIAQATAKNRNEKNTEEDDKKAYTYNGAENSVNQGNPIPLVYGRMLVGSQVVSASMTTDTL